MLLEPLQQNPSLVTWALSCWKIPFPVRTILLRVITICPLSNSLRSAAIPITRKSKRKNDYLPSPAAVKYLSHFTTCPPRHLDEFIEKCGDGHNVLARQRSLDAMMHLIIYCNLYDII
ncbi:hypothetical protein AVEN_232374-1 [Araneus ventricosus]|uniref:Uncharacterized protein n=1 Tax=Araneus ventricosus TaxID=182803 RepID=A0A4Y2CTX4_ARAVE|nr:hypothetical protein AVEN_232374-1 [Araneus ventricosus]